MLFRINKNDGKLLYQIAFNLQDDVNAYIQPKGQPFLYGCGQKASNIDPGYWKIQSNGDVQFHRSLSMIADSICHGITYDPIKYEATLLILSNVEAIKAVNSGYLTTKPNDAFLFVISDSGSVSRARQVSFSSSYSTTLIN